MGGPEYVFFNGEVVPYAEAKVHISAPAIKYGAGVFEGIRAYWNHEGEQLYVFRLAEHSKRLANSIKIMRMESSFTVDELSDAVVAVVQANQFREDVHVRQIVFVDGNGLVEAQGPVGIAATALPRGRSSKSAGMHLSVSSWTRILDNAMPPRVKCVANYQNSRLAYLQAKMDGYDGTILLDSGGKVTEAQTSCLFLVRDGVPVTSPITSSILESITRATLIQLLDEVHNLTVQQRAIDRTELYVADEAFVCGSGAEIIPVVAIDRHKLGEGRIGPITKAIQGTYFDIVRGINPAHGEWRTPIYK